MLEIGCTYGLSSLFICGALIGHPDARQAIIDPLQSTEWRGIGASRANIPGYPRSAVLGAARRSAHPPSLKRRLFEWPLRTLAGGLPADYRTRVFDDSLTRPDFPLGFVSEIGAPRKKGPDRRD